MRTTSVLGCRRRKQVASLLVQQTGHVVGSDLVLKKMRHDDPLVLSVVRVVGRDIVSERENDPRVARGSDVHHLSFKNIGQDIAATTVKLDAVDRADWLGGEDGFLAGRQVQGKQLARRALLALPGALARPGGAPSPAPSPTRGQKSNSTPSLACSGAPSTSLNCSPRLGIFSMHLVAPTR